MGYALIADRYDLLVEFGADLEPAPGSRRELGDQRGRADLDVPHARGRHVAGRHAVHRRGRPRSSSSTSSTATTPPTRAQPRPTATTPTATASAPTTRCRSFDSYLDLDGGLENTRITSIEAPDAQTLVITTSEPIATLAQMYIPMLPQAHLGGDHVRAGRQPSLLESSRPIGTGPVPDARVRAARRSSCSRRNDDLLGRRAAHRRARVPVLRQRRGPGQRADQRGRRLPRQLPAHPRRHARWAQPNVTINVAAAAPTSPSSGFNSWAPDSAAVRGRGLRGLPERARRPAPWAIPG